MKDQDSESENAKNVTLNQFIIQHSSFIILFTVYALMGCDSR